MGMGMIHIPTGKNPTDFFYSFRLQDEICAPLCYSTITDITCTRMTVEIFRLIFSVVNDVSVDKFRLRKK